MSDYEVTLVNDNSRLWSTSLLSIHVADPCYSVRRPFIFPRYDEIVTYTLLTGKSSLFDSRVLKRVRTCAPHDRVYHINTVDSTLPRWPLEDPCRAS